MSDTFKVLAADSIEVAAAMGCHGHEGPILFSEDNEPTCFWFMDEPEPRSILQQIKDGTLNVNLKQLLLEMQKLQERIFDQQAMNVEYRGYKKK